MMPGFEGHLAQSLLQGLRRALPVVATAATKAGTISRRIYCILKRRFCMQDCIYCIPCQLNFLQSGWELYNNGEHRGG